jgi:hypothetical protein
MAIAPDGLKRYLRPPDELLHALLNDWVGSHIRLSAHGTFGRRPVDQLAGLDHVAGGSSVMGLRVADHADDVWHQRHLQVHAGCQAHNVD